MLAPGRFSNADGSKFGAELRDIHFEQAMEGWETTHAWMIISSTDADGWHYGANRTTEDWYDTAETGLYVRRRKWVSEISKISTPNVIA